MSIDLTTSDFRLNDCEEMSWRLHLAKRYLKGHICNSI